LFDPVEEPLDPVAGAVEIRAESPSCIEKQPPYNAKF